MELKAKVSIGMVYCSQEDDYVSIEITDSNSGIRVVSVKMEPGMFAMAITGLGYCNAEFNYVPTTTIAGRIGKNRETKRIWLDKPDYKYNKEKQKAKILKAVEDSGELVDGWMLFSDGTSTQQNSEKHEVILYRFV